MGHKPGSFLQDIIKTDNHPANEADKVMIRENVLNAISKPRVVLDAFCGAGVMYRKIWNKADDYIWCDQRWFPDERMVYVCDSRRILRTLDLNRFNVFDLDSYGSPWEHAIIISSRRQVEPGERVGIILTEGSGMKLKFGALPGALGILAGVHAKMPAANRWHRKLLDRAILAIADRMRCRVVKRWQAERKAGAAMIYVGLVLEGMKNQ
jgi:hypothetical protein